MSDWRSEEKEKLGDRAAGRFWTPERGENRVRFINNRKDKKGKPPKRPWFEYRVHYKVGPDERTATCGIGIDGSGECYICNKVEKMKKSDNRAKVKRAEALEAVPTIAFQIAYLKEGSKKQKGPMLWTVRKGSSGKSLDAKLIGILTDKKRFVADPIKGYILNFEKLGSGKKRTSYENFVLDEDPTPVSKEVLKEAKAFEDLIYPYDEKYCEAAWLGKEFKRDDDDDEDEDEDDEDSKKKKKSEKSKDEDEDDEDDEKDEEDDSDDDEDDDDEDSKKKKKKKKKSDSDDDDDDEDADESDDEDEDEDSGDDDDESDDSDEDEDDDDGGKKKSSKKAGKKSKKSKSKSDDDDEDDEEDSEDEEDSDDDDESDDDEDSDDSDDDDEDVKKKKKKSKKSKKDEDEDEDDEDDEDSDDDDDEEDEKPKSKKKSKKKK